jgi:coniferyl-aldehyde dehydrogenase
MAEDTGTQAVAMEPQTDGLRLKRKFPLTLLLNPSMDSRAMREEIFGPVLPVIEVESIDAAIQQVNAGDRPLALYFFGHSERTQEKLLRNTHAGGVTINDVMLQYLQVAQPFGGVGASGYGSYHGREGFETFSHLKSVFSQRGLGNFTGLKLLYPPYGPIARRLIGMMGG